jgi:uncharacterized phage protein (TIGR02220 family)
MGKDPAFLFYPNDYLGGTMGMTFEEKGAYIELLMLQFNRGHMTKHMVGQTVGQLWVKLEDKFVVDDDGLYYNERLELEIFKRKNYVKSRNNNALGTNQYSKSITGETGHMTKHTTGRMEDVNRDVNKDVIINDNIPYKEIIDYLNLKANTKFQHTSTKTKTLIAARYNDKFTIDDFKRVIDIKCLEWLNDEKYSIYLRPETLFGTKFESYLNQKSKQLIQIPITPLKIVTRTRGDDYVNGRYVGDVQES